MSTFVPGCLCDVYVSFAPEDNVREDPSDPQSQPWVARLIDRLNTLVGRKLGNRNWGEIWCSSAESDGSLSALAEERLRHCAVFVVVLTKAHLSSPTFRLEFEAFLESVHQDEELVDRVHVVLRDNLPREEWPEKLQHLLPHELLHEANGDADRSNESQSRLYSMRLDALSSDLAGQLGSMANASEMKDPAVFLADAPTKLEEFRASVKRYLIQDGLSIVPRSYYPRDEGGHRQAAVNDIKQSAIFVQLLGVESPSQYGRIQLECANQLGKKVLQWRSLDLDLASVTDKVQRELLVGEHVIACGLEEFKRKVVKEGHKAAAPLEESHGEEAAVVINASEVDQQLANDVGDVLSRNGLHIVVETNKELGLSMRASPSRLAGLLIVYGACPAIWVRQQLWQYRKAMARLESAPPICAVYEGPPQAKDPVRFKLPTLKIINGRDNLDETLLHPFIAAVRGRYSE